MRSENGTYLRPEQRLRPERGGDLIGYEIRRFVQRSLHASASIFYWIEDEAAAQDAVVSGLPSGLWGEYLADMVELDPLSVRAMVGAGARMARLTSDKPPTPPRYQHFLERYGVRDVIDMLFYVDGTVVAGLGIIKLFGDAPMSSDALDLAAAMRPLIEASLLGHERVQRALRHRRLVSIYNLTSREVDVAELVADGHSNDAVAKSLAIRLPTVKSHLLSIFGKTATTNRTELARLLHP